MTFGFESFLFFSIFNAIFIIVSSYIIHKIYFGDNTDAD